MKNNILSLLAMSALLFSACGDKSTTDSATPVADAAIATAPASGGSMPLTTEIPPELIEGTPMPIKVPNLEQALTAAPTLAVPAGTKLLSAGKEVTASDDFPIIGELSYITDGDKDAGEGYFVEIMDGPQWMQIDLGAPAELAAVWVWHYHSQKRAYHDVIVQVSNDPEFASGVTASSTATSATPPNWARQRQALRRVPLRQAGRRQRHKSSIRSPLQQRQHLQRHEPLY